MNLWQIYQRYLCQRKCNKRAKEYIGAKTKSFGLHSLRAGGAAGITNLGVNYRLFKKHVRRKWDTFKKKIFFYQGFALFPQDSRWREGPSFIQLYYFHPLTSIQTFILQLWTWDDYHIFLITPLLFTRLPLDKIYHLIELLFDWLMMWSWLLFLYLLT